LEAPHGAGQYHLAAAVPSDMKKCSACLLSVCHHAYQLKIQTVVFDDLCNSLMVVWYDNKNDVN